MTAPATAEPALTPVLSAAAAAFAEHGYHGASVRDIAARAGLSVPGMYHHHASKQDLLRALMEGSVADLLDRSKAAVEAAGDDPVARLSGLVRTLVGFMAEHRELAVLQAEARYLEPDNWRRYVALRDEQQALFADAIADGQAAGVFAGAQPTDDVTRAVLTLCLGVATWYRPDGPLDPAGLADQYVGFCLGLAGCTSGSTSPRPRTRSRKDVP